MTPDLHQQQIDIENQYSHESILASIKQTQDALDHGRIGDTSIGRRIITKAYAETKAELLGRMDKAGNRGVAGKYFNLIRRVDINVAVIACIRATLGYCTQENSPTLQDILRNLGGVIETEAMIAAIEVRNKAYLDKTVEYLDKQGTTNLRHRSRTFNAAAEALKMEWNSWTALERVHVGKLMMQAIYSTGLFKFEDNITRVRRISPLQVIKPSEALEKHLQKALEAARSIVRFPPMIVPPLPRTGLTDGGYLTPWYQLRAELVTLKTPRAVRKWVVEGLGEGKALELKAAMTAAQEVPYRINKKVLGVLGAATARGTGEFGTPRTAPPPKAEFPFADGWDREKATPEDMLLFTEWKSKMHEWHTNERTRLGQNAGMVAKLREMRRFKDYDAIYFPTFVDWRGRLYFRSSLNPQSNDSVKGCIEFAEGKVLGERGLFWLKVHIANCAGFDKHLPEIKAQFVDDNMEMLLDFYNNPLDVEAPEPETTCTLYHALAAYVEALELDDPTQYVCHVPVAMDATCSGLQHFSAMLRDEEGALHTNLTNNGLDQKSDIYKHVGELADELKSKQTKDVVIQKYWEKYAVTRSMAKRSVMTFVYGSTLTSTIDYIMEDMQADGMPDIIDDADGTVIYGHRKLVTPVAKAVRLGVQLTVPAAERGMKYLQSIARATDYPVQWLNPVGMPVINWAEIKEVKRISIRSMGRVDALVSTFTGQYDKRGAVSGISPNFVHSMDSGHLCKVLANNTIRILPNHDSFATHPCDVDELHTSLREEFVSMYKEDLLSSLASSVIMHADADVTLPTKGNFDLQDVLNSPFMFC